MTRRYHFALLASAVLIILTTPALAAARAPRATPLTQDLESSVARMAKIPDRPIAALLTDLKQHGLLDSTLVVWGGEFGRTPTMEGRGNFDS